MAPSLLSENSALDIDAQDTAEVLGKQDPVCRMTRN